jgi:tripartite-type tricarboxylate transporter receptor subunit TctC
MMLNRRQFTHGLAAGLSALALPGATVRAQAIAPIKLLVGFAPGGSVDLTARALADSMRAQLGRPVVVENRPGAAGRLAPEAVRQAKPDGETLMLVPHGPMTLFPWIHQQLRYDPFQDFAPIGRLCIVDYAISTGPASGATTLADYLTWARRPAAKPSCATPGAGTVPHFIAEGFAQKAGLDLTHVHYKGSAPGMVDLIGGSVSLSSSPLADAVEHHRSGKIRILATTGQQRAESVSGVPTLREAGVDLVMDGWYGIYAPAGLNPQTQRELSRAIAQPSAALTELFARSGLRSAPTSPEALTEIQRAEHRQWEAWVKASGFKPEA